MDTLARTRQAGTVQSSQKPMSGVGRQQPFFSVFSVLSVVKIWVAFLMAQGAAVAQPALSTADRAVAREIFEELVEIPSTEADGTGRAAQMLATRLIAAGLPKEDVQVLGPDAKTQNLVARLRGRNSQARALLLMAHID